MRFQKLSVEVAQGCGVCLCVLSFIASHQRDKTARGNMTIPTKQANSHILTHFLYTFENSGGQREACLQSRGGFLLQFWGHAWLQRVRLQGTPAVGSAAQASFLSQLAQLVLAPST